MTHRRRVLTALALPALVATVLAGCRGGGSVQITPVFPNRAALSIPRDVSFLRVTVRGAGMSDITHTEPIKDSGVIEVPGIPAGKARAVLLEGLDDAELVNYFGSGAVDIGARSNVDLSITLAAAFPGAGVSIVQSPTTNRATVDLSVALAGADNVTVANDQTFALGRQSFAVSTLTKSGERWLIPGWNLDTGLTDTSNGPRLVYVRMTSAEGVVSRAYSAQTRLDSLAPTLTAAALLERCDDWPDARIAQDAIWVPTPASLACTKAGFAQGPIRASFALNEARNAAAMTVYVKQGGSKLPLTIDAAASTDAFVVAYYAPSGNESSTPGEKNLFADVVDGAGNHGEVAIGELRFDVQAPAAPDVDTTDCLAYQRIPWGNAESPVHRSVLGTSKTCATPIIDAQTVAVVAFESGFAAGSAPTAARQLGLTPRVDVPTPGQIKQLQLTGSDVAQVFVAARDAAGNLSQARRVRTVWWTATLGGKVAANTSNPNRLLTASQFSSGLTQTFATEATLDTPATSVSAPRWRALGSNFLPVADYYAHTMAWDDQRGRLIHSMWTGAGGETWAFDGQSWQRLCGGGSACFSPNFDGSGAVTYDERSGEVLLVQTEQMWAFDGSNWRQVCGAGTNCAMPHIGQALALTYDSHRGVVVLVSETGIGRGYYTAEWDGLTWTVFTPALQAQPREFSSGPMVFHRARGTSVCGASSKILEWNGTVWSPLPTGPTGYDGASYDPDRGVMVAFIGQDPLATTQTALWELDDVGWTKVCGPGTSCVGPPARRNPHLGYDGVQRRTVLLGGAAPTGNTAIIDSWLWDGQEWSRLCTSSTCEGPSWSDAAMAYHAERSVGVLFGGHDQAGTVFSDETWFLGGAGTWSLCDPASTCATRPTSRSNHAMAYAPSGHAVYMFGGILGSGGKTNQTWSWDGAWTLLCGTGSACSQTPSARADSQMTYDTVRDRLVMFGGAFPSGANTDQLWERGSSGWVQLCGAGTACSGPTGAYTHAMAFDANRGVSVMHDNDMQETWEWNGTSWSKRWSANGGVPVYGAEATYDEASGRVVIAGQESWAWEGDRWRKLCGSGTSCVQTTNAFVGLSGAYDPRYRGVVLHDGLGGNGVIDAGGGTHRPFHVFEASFGSAGPPDTSLCLSSPSTCPLEFIQVDWTAGGDGFDGGAAQPGAALYAWYEGNWAYAGVPHAAPSSAPGQLQFFSSDPTVVAQLLTTRAQKLYFAVAPIASAGFGVGKLTSTAVEVTVGYRLP